MTSHQNDQYSLFCKDGKHQFNILFLEPFISLDSFLLYKFVNMCVFVVVVDDVFLFGLCI